MADIFFEDFPKNMPGTSPTGALAFLEIKCPRVRVAWCSVMETMPDSDESLLKAFALNRDGAAFRTLAERYSGLIFHTALRRTNSRPLAEEVSQNILCALAKKAGSLAKNPDLLPAWLHRATLFESSKAMRSESSYQRRKQLVHPDVIGIEDEGSHWHEAVPHLDLALDQLSESDRAVLLLHYFKNRPFPNVARTLGRSTTAVRKQSQRALEKLARILKGRGVTLTVAAVATGLSAEFAKVAPAALVGSCVNGVISGSATYSTTALTIMTVSKSKAAIPIALLACALPLALQEVAISSARTRIGQLQVTPAPRVARDGEIAMISNRSEPNNLAAWRHLASRSAMHSEEMMAFMRDKRIEIELRDRLTAMTPDQILKLMEQHEAWDPYGVLQQVLRGALFEKDPKKALLHFEDQLARVEDTVPFMKAFKEWMAADAADATAWLDAMIASGKLRLPRYGIRTNEQCRNQMEADLSCVAIVEQLKADPESAIRRFQALEHDQQEFVIRSGLSFKVQPGSEAGVVTFMRTVLPEDEYRVLLEEGPQIYKGMVGNIARDGDLETVGRFLDSVQAIPEERRVFGEAAVAPGLYRLKGGEEGVVDRAAVQVLREWLAREAPGNAGWLTGCALARINDGFQTTAPLVEALHEESGDDGILIGYLENKSGSKDVPERMAMAAKISDETKRDEIMAKLQR